MSYFTKNYRGIYSLVTGAYATDDQGRPVDREGILIKVVPESEALAATQGAEFAQYVKDSKETK